jgi:PPOX class probable F420-dependent enzyme
MDLSMSPAERFGFLGDAARVGVLSIEAPDRGPVSAPVWYTLEADHTITFSVGETSRKAVLLRAARRATMCVQSEDAPYRYVSIEGAVADLGSSDDASRRERAIRYLGPELGETYFASTRAEADATFALRPHRWASIDYNKLFG